LCRIVVTVVRGVARFRLQIWKAISPPITPSK